MPSSHSTQHRRGSDEDEAVNNSSRLHDWEYTKENAAPLECGRSVKSLSKRAFGTTMAEQSEIERKSKKYEKLVRRCEHAVEWMQKESKKLLDKEQDDGGDASPRQLTEEEADFLRQRLRTESSLRFDTSTTDRDHVDYDPLRYWVLYVKHIRESYPSDSKKQFLLMERCTRTFMSRPFLFPSYQNDPRFIRTCILYADKTSDPSVVFKLMNKIKVGTKVALFWVAWAFVAEKASDFSFTEKIFQKGLSVGAEPRKFLEERQKQFIRRMHRHWINANKKDGDDFDEEDDVEEEHGGRGALNSLTSAGIASNNRSAAFNGQGQQGTLQGNRSHQTAPQPPRQEIGRNSSRSHQGGRNNVTAVAGFNIFQDNDENSPNSVLNDDENAPGHLQLTRESERTKENNMRPEQWNERGYGLINPSEASRTIAVADSIVGTVRHPSPGRSIHRGHSTAPAFDVFVDEECSNDEKAKEESKKAQKADDRSLRQRLDGGTADRLHRDPLRYMNNPSKVKSDIVKYDGLSRDTDSKVARGNEKVREVKPTEEDNTKLKPSEKEGCKKPEMKRGKIIHSSFNLKLLSETDSNDECCYEELFFRAGNPRPVLAESNVNCLEKVHVAAKEDEDGEVSADEDSVSMGMDMDVDDNDEETRSERAPIGEDPERYPIAGSTFVDPMASKRSLAPKSILRSNACNQRTTENLQSNPEEETSSAIPRRVLFNSSTPGNVNNNDAVNTSSASSEPNSSFVQPEETINTKFAHAEISMMFCSPTKDDSFAATPGKPLLESAYKQPLFSTNRKDKKLRLAAGKSPPPEGIADENSKPSRFTIFSDECESEQQNLPPSPTVGCSANENAKSSHFTIFSDETTEQESSSHSFDNVATNEKEKSSGFTIFNDDDAHERITSTESDLLVKKQSSTPMQFTIFSDECDTAQKGINTKVNNKIPPSHSSGLEFNIFNDDSDDKAEFAEHSSKTINNETMKDVRKSGEDTDTFPSLNKILGTEQKCPGQNDSSSPTSARYSGGDTATLTGIRDILGSLQSCSVEDPCQLEEKTTIQICDYSESQNRVQQFMGEKQYELKGERRVAFGSSVGERKTETKMKPSGSNARRSANQASTPMEFGIFKDVDENEKDSSRTEHPTKRSCQFSIHSDENQSSHYNAGGTEIQIFDDGKHDKRLSQYENEVVSQFEIYSDEVGDSAKKKRKVAGSIEEPYFGDISRIDALDAEKTLSAFSTTGDTSGSISQKANATLVQKNVVDSIDYTSFHTECMEFSMRMCLNAAKKSNGQHRDFRVFDHRERSLPKALLRKSFSSGTTIDLLGGTRATIINELGRGVYGVVLLCEVLFNSNREEDKQIVALKIQAPIGSLAHEYCTLKSLENRIKMNETDFYPFPRPRALYAFSEGGLFLMTAGSDSGTTLLDVVNTYKEIRGGVPELIALYYTTRMMKHLESLHEEGHILHCDVKPDNWVLTSSPDSKDTANGADLMLVDFGRAVDLDNVKVKGSDPRKTLFKGSVAAEDMECGTMRQGMPWGVELDLFGLSASSFILLFGEHIEVVQNKISGKWALKKRFRRYWQKDLWQQFFDLLLNFDSNTEMYRLIEIRRAFDEYINGRDRIREIESNLLQMHNYLPKTR